MNYLSLPHKIHFAMKQLVPAGLQHQEVLKIKSSKGNFLLNIEGTCNNNGEEHF